VDVRRVAAFPPPARRPPADDRYFHALDRVARGESLSAAARAERISPERLRSEGAARRHLSTAYDKETGKRLGWEVSPNGPKPVLTADGRFVEAVQFDRRGTSRVAAYWYAVRQLIDDGDPSPLLALGPSYVVVAADGTLYRFATDPNLVLRWWAALTAAERRRLGELLGSEKILVRRGRT
jgi:hypothetical protein